MIKSSILGFLASINIYSGSYDEDFVDRMNNVWSVYIMILLAIIISAGQMFGNAIDCWFPAEFPNSWEQYAENYCWVQNTYFVPVNQTIPLNDDKRSKAELAYYQWVPFVLALQGLMFYIPAMVWRLMNWQTGVNIKGLLTVASDIEATDEAGITRIKSLLHKNVDYGEKKSKEWKRQIVRILVCFNGNQRFGNYVVSAYLLTKVLYVVNIVCQFYLVQAFIGVEGHNHAFYGFEMLSEISSGDDWKVTGHFPRITLCDFAVRALGQTHKYTVQCVLPVNMLNEKIYIFVFFWLLVMGALTCISLINWAVKIVIRNGEDFLRKYIPKDEYENEPSRESVLRKIVKQDLKRDGIFVLRLLSSNIGEVITSRIVKRLWDETKAAMDEDMRLPPFRRHPDDVPLLPLSRDNPYPSLDDVA